MADISINITGEKNNVSVQTAEYNAHFLYLYDTIIKQYDTIIKQEERIIELTDRLIEEIKRNVEIDHGRQRKQIGFISSQ